MTASSGLTPFEVRSAMAFDPKSATMAEAPPSGLSPAGAPPRVSSVVGTIVDSRYSIEGFIGEGGMGIVYLARHRLLDKVVAMKVLRREIAHNQEMVERFLLEARSASSIGDPHIVSVTDFGLLPDGSTYLVMEHIDGVTLKQLLRKGEPLPLRRVLHIAKQIARGLAAAHAAGVVHRDLKPENVMLVRQGDDDDFVKVLDFGIAKAASAPTTSMTGTGRLLGTPHYMSPEQASGDPVDAATDVYALGVMLYEAVAGRVPFDAENVITLLSMHVNRAPVPLRAAAARDDVPASLEALVMRCLAKQAAERFPSMAALADELEAVDDDVVFASVGGVASEAPTVLSKRLAGAAVLRAAPMPAVPPPPPSSNAILPAWVGVADGAHPSAPPSVQYAPVSSRRGGARVTAPPRAAGLAIVVDDSEICREIATIMLEEEGFAVMALADPAALTDALGASRPAIVLIDVTMPGMGGEAVIRKVRADIGVTCPLVLHSDLSEEQLAPLAAACEASGYMRKTADGERFREQLRRFLVDAT